MKHVGKLAAATAAGVIIVMSPALAMANSHGNACASGAVRQTSEQRNTHQNDHSNLHINDHGNAHVNEHVNLHVNEHWNIQDEHINFHVSEHVNIHEDQHTIININGYTVEQLRADLVRLGCSNVDDLCGYLQSASWTHQDVDSIRVNIEQLTELCGSVNWSTCTAVEKRQLWEACQRAVKSVQLSCVCVDDFNRPVDIVHCKAGQHIHLQFKDHTGRCLTTISLSTGGSLTTGTQTQHKATPGTNPTTITVSTKPTTSTSPTPTPTTSTPPATAAAPPTQGQPAVQAGELPKTASDDPLLIAIGALLVMLGLSSWFGIRYLARTRNRK